MGSKYGNSVRVIDPVCGVQIDPAKTDLIYALQGHTYHFCAKACRTEFRDDPQKYLDLGIAPKKRKNWWGRYLDRIQKATDGKPPKCCQ